jgi:hypothetical protein
MKNFLKEMGDDLKQTIQGKGKSMVFNSKGKDSISSSSTIFFGL